MDYSILDRSRKDYKVISSELVDSYHSGYIGKDTYLYTLGNGETKKCDCITKGNRNGDAVIIVPILENGNYLMILESRPLTKENTVLEFPAGMVDDGEDFKEAALRELLEETGCVPSSIHELEWHYQDQGCSKAVVKTYVALGCNRVCEQKLDNQEYLVPLEISKEELLGLLFENKDIVDANTKIAALTYSLKR